MKNSLKRKLVTLAAMIIAAAAMPAQTGIIIATTAVENRSNPAETSTGLGAVNYKYRIGTYEVTNAQYAAFLNAKAAVTDTGNLYNTDMGAQHGGITRTTITDGYTYAVKSGFANKPVNYVSFWDATRFTNWLSNGQGSGSTEDGSYALTEVGILGNVVTRRVGADWVVPNEDEWYKAAYYDPNKGGTGVGGYWQHATESDALGDNTANAATNGANYFDSANNDYANGGLSGPGTTNVGSYANASSFYGTFDQAGNVSEWNEGDIGGGERMLRGGSWEDGEGTLRSSLLNGGGLATAESFGIGFRVASLPPVLPNPEMLYLGRAAAFALLSTAAITTSTIDFSGPGAKKIGITTSATWTRNGELIGVGPSDIHIGNTTTPNNVTAGNAWSDALTTYDSAKALVQDGLSSGATKIINGELQGKTFTHGMYTVGTTPLYALPNNGAFTMTGDFTLDGEGDANSVFIFQTEAAASTAAGMKMSLIGGAQADHVFWLVGASFSTGANAAFVGSVIAWGASTIGANTEFEGQLIVLDGAITAATGFKGSISEAIPEPGTYGVVMGVVGLGVVMMRRRKTRGRCRGIVIYRKKAFKTIASKLAPTSESVSA